MTLYDDDVSAIARTTITPMDHAVSSSPGRPVNTPADRSAIALRGAAGDGLTPSATRDPVVIAIKAEEDLLTARHAVREEAVEAGFGLVDQTRVVTAASELARNTYVHGGGGTLTIEHLVQPARRGLRLSFLDHGPGILDLEAALADGYTTGAGLGHGLGGARRLMDSFEVSSVPGRGTRVVVSRWTRA